ncbi:copper amine oxidase [Paenibacillus sp. FSL k6-2145]|uniref:copper amine oxidase n=1 Tax=Paenibacillus sp. FSL k6-2145 TaxID=2976834 RepID=UPI0030DA372C
MKKFAHKVAYIAGGIIIGIVFSTSAGAFADQVKSLVGKKVTGEYTIIVDGKKLSDKGALIDSKANVPARALSEALGADVSVSGKIITITSENSIPVGTEETSPVSNTYSGKSKAYLESMQNEYKTKIIPPIVQGRNDVVKGLEEVRKSENVEAIAKWEKSLSEYDAEIAKYEAELKLIAEALLTAK